MSKVSRRELARYAAEQLVAGKPAKKIAKELSAVLAAGRRVSEAPLLLEDIAWELERRGYFAQAQVTTAHGLAPALRQKLGKVIKSASGVGHIELEEKVDSSVLGGVRIETAVHSWDETIAKRLNELKGTI